MNRATKANMNPGADFQLTVWQSPRGHHQSGVLGREARWGEHCHAEAIRINAIPGRVAEVRTNDDGMCALFVNEVGFVDENRPQARRDR